MPYSITLDPHTNWAKILGPDPNSMYLNPKNCSQGCITQINKKRRAELLITLLFTWFVPADRRGGAAGRHRASRDRHPPSAGHSHRAPPLSYNNKSWYNTYLISDLYLHENNNWKNDTRLLPNPTPAPTKRKEKISRQNSSITLGVKGQLWIRLRFKFKPLPPNKNSA